jgi:hypothetical protein
LNGGDSGYIEFNLYKSDETDRYPMSWAISKANLAAMDERLDEHPMVRGFIGMMNGRGFDSLPKPREDLP